MAEKLSLAQLIMRYPHLGFGLSPAEKEALQNERDLETLQSTCLQGLPEMAVTDGEDVGTSPLPLLSGEDPEC